MSSNLAVYVKELNKSYKVYKKPIDRLKQMLLGGFRNYYSKHTALESIELAVSKGETVGIIGRNGSGKSTLLQILCGTLAASSGTIKVDGKVAALLELGSGFNPEFSGRENIFLNGAILGLTQAEIEDSFDDIVTFSGIQEYIDQPVKTYSSGMIVRLAFSVIAHVNADILIIDEALSVGDAFFVQKCMRFLRKFMETGTVIFVSHDTSAVLNLCDRAVWLDQGNIRAVGEAKEVVERYLAGVYEAEQGEGPELIGTTLEKKTQTKRDMRLNFINQTALRNDIELFEFNRKTAKFGTGKAYISDVSLLDGAGASLSWVVGGESVCLKVSVKAETDIFMPIVGFQVKDRLGQVIFGDNTYLSYLNQMFNVLQSEMFEAVFHFEMPLMPVGDYTISAAVAEGTQKEHVQHEWLHDAIAFKVHSTSVCHGLVGIPMQAIEFRKV